MIKEGFMRGFRGQGIPTTKQAHPTEDREEDFRAPVFGAVLQIFYAPFAEEICHFYSAVKKG